MAELVNIAEQFKGLPMGELIGAPLTAACDAQIRLAQATANFIQTVGFLQDENGVPTATRQVTFSFRRPAEGAGPSTPGGTFYEEEVELSVPLLAIVKIPNLSITTVDITFDMEVKSAFSAKEGGSKSGTVKASASGGFGPFKASVEVSGSISSHQENTRSSDNSAKYHVEVHAADGGMPEGLSRVMDILQTAVAPRSISGPKQVTNSSTSAGATPVAAPVAQPA
ncbi:hypothetical protein CDN99_25510 [Roseateles aquatilis]|uniref:DUF2589 domain-containing protein n=1 Tax=Roseateles aquatilis TaxID=431061 RepID=A0A246IUF2_9BURK|nr:DUF2589 domain-containing protein [Roseateles aquatilis]OWQ83826.1 hypothetical protein CDN99_25510 [Roseateles aquatilis]